MRSTLYALLLGEALLLGLLITIIVVAHATRLATERRRERIRAELRPVLVRFMADEAGPIELPDLRRSHAALFDVLATDFLNKVKGDARDRLVQLLTDRGEVDEAQQRCRSWSAGNRRAAASFLGAVRQPEAFESLAPLLRDADPDVRLHAALALGRCGNPLAVEPLLASLTGSRSLPFTIVGGALVDIGAGAIQPLRIGLRTGTAVARAVAAEVLGILEAQVAVDDLLAHIDARKESEGEVRIRAARALGRLGAPASVGPLAALLRPGGAASIRAVAARALGEIGGPEAIPALVSAMGDPVHLVATNAAAALARCGKPGRTALEDAAAHDDEASRHAKEAIARADTAHAARRPSSTDIAKPRHAS